MGASSEIGTEEKVRIDFKNKFQNNSVKRVQTKKMENNSFVRHKIFNHMNIQNGSNDDYKLIIITIILAS